MLRELAKEYDRIMRKAPVNYSSNADEIYQKMRNGEKEDLIVELIKIDKTLVATEDNFEDVYDLRNMISSFFEKLNNESDEESEEYEELEELNVAEILKEQLDMAAGVSIQFAIVETDKGTAVISRGLDDENMTRVTITVDGEIVEDSSGDYMSNKTNAVIILANKAIIGGARDDEDFKMALKCLMR